MDFIGVFWLFCTGYGGGTYVGTERFGLGSFGFEEFEAVLLCNLDYLFVAS